MKISDAIGISFIVIGLALTALNLFAARKPFAPFGNGSGVESFTVREIAPHGAGKPI